MQSKIYSWMLQEKKRKKNKPKPCSLSAGSHGLWTHFQKSSVYTSPTPPPSAGSLPSLPEQRPEGSSCHLRMDTLDCWKVLCYSNLRPGSISLNTTLCSHTRSLILLQYLFHNSRLITPHEMVSQTFIISSAL